MAEFGTYGAAIRAEARYTEATAVAHMMMERARHNIELLVPRLQQLNYQFAYPDSVWSPTTPALIHVLDRLEAQHGLLPVIVRSWFEVVGFVNFMGMHPKLSCYARSEWHGLSTVYGDPIVVELLPHDQVQLSNYEEGSYTADPNEDKCYYDFYELPFAPDICFKARESGGGPMLVLIPSPMFDAPIIDPGEIWTGTFFLHHLQTCFEWGGFPGLRHLPEAEQPKEELAFLTKDLLPLI